MGMMAFAWKEKGRKEKKKERNYRRCMASWREEKGKEKGRRNVKASQWLPGSNTSSAMWVTASTALHIIHTHTPCTIRARIRTSPHTHTHRVSH